MDAVDFLLEPRANRVLNTHPKIATNNITTHGSNWLWAVMALHAFLLLAVIAWTFTTNPRRRAFHYFSIAILLIASIYYFVMASNLGARAVPVEFRRHYVPSHGLNPTREVFWVRWIGYFINFPLVIFSLLLLSGVGWATILFTIGLTMLWATMHLVGALVSTSYKWGFFGFGVFIYLFIAWQLMGVAKKYAARVDVAANKTYSGLAAYILFLMLLYSVCWGLSEGGNVLHLDSETVFYGILDILTQGIFSLLIILGTRNLDFDRMGLGFTEYGRIHDNEHWRGLHGKNGHHNGTSTGAPATTTV